MLTITVLVFHDSLSSICVINMYSNSYTCILIWCDHVTQTHKYCCDVTTYLNTFYILLRCTQELTLIYCYGFSTLSNPKYCIFTLVLTLLMIAVELE